MRRAILAIAFLLVPVVAQAQHPTIRDIIELSKAGLSEEVLLALIEVHRPVYPVDADTLKALKEAGVSQNVIVAIVKSGRTPPPVPEPVVTVVETAAPAPPPPQVVIVEHEPRVREVAVPVPVYVAVPARRIHHDGDADDRGRRERKQAEPVYWGWGGKLRPDAWKPSPADVKGDAKKGPDKR